MTQLATPREHGGRLRWALLGVVALLTLAQIGFAIYVTAYCRLPVSEGTSKSMLLLTFLLVAVSIALYHRKR